MRRRTQHLPGIRLLTSAATAVSARSVLHCGLLITTLTAFAQRASSWRVFKVADGVAEPACASVSVAVGGQVLVTHPNANSVTVLDGYLSKLFR